MERRARWLPVVLEIAAAYPMVGSARHGWSWGGMTQRIDIVLVPEAAIRGM